MAFSKGSSGEKRARKTIAFDGSAGNGQVGVTTVFTLTGRVLITKMTIFCTETLAQVTANAFSLGVTGGTVQFINAQTASGFAANDWVGTTTSPTATLAIPAAHTNTMIAANIIITAATTDITDGTLIFDVWYTPITDNGALA